MASLLARTASVPRLMPAAGLVVAVAVAAGTLEVAGVTAAGPVMALGHSGSAVWLACPGGLLLRRPRR